MVHLERELATAIEAVRHDRLSGAAEVAGQAVAILARSFQLRQVDEAALALCRAQPSMAPVWNAAIHAVAANGNAEAFAAYADRVRRAPASVTRFATALFADSGVRPLQILTLSASGSVVRVIETLAQTRPVSVTCSESRPALEGRQLTTHLAALGIPVVHYADAALALGLEGADAVLVGADAVGPDALINKIGTLMIGAAAAMKGVPVYVIATRDKFAMPAVWPHLSVREGPPEDIWDAAPSGTAVRNPYFERVPLDLISAVISDHGVLGAALLGDVCQAMQTDRTLAALDSLLAGDATL
ncbi:MAG TPA: hypothetical protein VFV95_14765 [Vicinamibacterales bacterium]|nr:hypothetical protein [Vicinamibacterales bacterium]